MATAAGSHGTATLLELKLRAQARQEEEQQQKILRRNLLLLCADFLQQSGYLQAAQALLQETQLSKHPYAVADNMDLERIVTEYEQYYQWKYKKPCKLVRATHGRDDSQNGSVEQVTSKAAAKPLQRQLKSQPTLLPSLQQSKPPASVGIPSALPPSLRAAYSNAVSDQSLSSNGVQTIASVASAASHAGATGAFKRPAKQTSQQQQQQPPVTVGGQRAADADDSSNVIAINGSTVQTISQSQKHSACMPSLSVDAPQLQSPSASAQPVDLQSPTHYDHQLLRPLPSFGSSELNELAQNIQRDILSVSPNVRWSDIVELESAKMLLRESVVLPMQYPAFFTGLLSPWKGILLYGPPGTGKTMLARAAATECQTVFFNISASSIVSKYRGESEKLVRVLFEMARYYSPSTIFIDEIDSIMGSRDGGGDGAGGGEHEGSRRLKTELLIQMDGVSKSTSEQVFVLAASNHPWQLDTALLRRLEKRILVPLPNATARSQMIQLHLKDNDRATGLQYNELADMTLGYSGADILLLCKEAAMRPVRRLMRKLSEVAPSSTSADAAHGGPDVGPDISIPLVKMRDVHAAIKCTKPSTSKQYLSKYEEWQTLYGSEYSSLLLAGDESDDEDA